MNKLYTLFLFILLPLVSFGQNFEGKIKFQQYYKSNMRGTTDAELNAAGGSTQEYFIKDGAYKSVTDGEYSEWQLYCAKENKLYNKFKPQKKVYWIDGAENPDELVEIVQTDNTVEILGYTCREIILVCKNSVQKYYFTDALPVDPALFKQHKFGNWADYVRAAKALPLKTVIKHKDYSFESLAVEVSPLELDEKMFQLAKGTKVVKYLY